MASISGVKGNYNIRFYYYDVFKNRKSKYKSGFKTKKDAETWAKNETSKLNKTNSDAPTSIAALIDAVLKEKELQGIEYNTMRKYKIHANYIKSYFGATSILNINKNHIIEFLEANKYNKDNKPVTERVIQIKKFLSLIYQYALSEEITTYNPLLFIKLPKPKIKYTTYTKNQIQCLLKSLKHANSFLYPVCLLALFFGLRRGEICALKKDNTANNIIDVKYSVYKNRDTGSLVTKNVKTKSGNRRLPFPDILKQELMWYQNTNNIQSEYSVCTASGERLAPDNVTSSFKAFLEQNDLPKIKLHELRHTFAKMSLENNTDLDTLKRTMGHSSIDITSNIYLHDDLSLIEKQINTVAVNLLQRNCAEIVQKD